ncbi:MAG: hypothetical protein IBX56_07690, partial [Methylomicrobium sp.]|nr:hypothetical protein [Methylomicrobium sp.]
KAGAIDQDTYTRALQKAGEAFNTHADDVRGLSESEAFRLKQLQDSLKIFEDQARLDLQNPFLQAQGTAGAESTKSAQRAQQIANEIAALNSPVTTGGQFPAVPAGAAQGVTAPVSVQPVVEIMPIIKPDVLLQTIQEAIESVRQQLQPLIVPFEYQLVGNMPGQNGVDEQILRESLARGRR